MPFRYIHMPVFGAYTCPQIRLSACLNRLFSMFVDNHELQKSIASNTPTRATSNTARIHQLGAILHTGSFLEGMGEEEDVWEDRRTRSITSTTATARASIDYIYCSIASLNPLRGLSSLNYSIRHLLPQC